MTIQQQAILQTLSYHARFSYPLTLNQLHHLLITKRPVSQNELKKDLANLVKKGKVKKEDGYFHFSTLISQLSTLRQKRATASQKKLKIATRAANLFARIPFIRLICVTGALALKNSDQDDDIDLMVVTSPNRLWLTRPLVVFLASLFFKRRKPIPSSFILHPSAFSNTLCLNLWLDKTALLMPPDKRNLVTAHELAQMKPLVNKGKTYEKMLYQNRWGSKFLANAWEETTKQRNNSFSFSKILSLLNPLNLINHLLYKLQYLYMRPRRTTEQVSLHAAFFHPLSCQTPPQTLTSIPTDA